MKDRITISIDELLEDFEDGLSYREVMKKRITDFRVSKKLKYHEQDEDVDYDHIKDCIEYGVLVSLVTFKDNLYYEFYKESNKSFVYDFESSRCNSTKDFLFWLEHLMEKRWVSKNHIKQFTNLFRNQFSKQRNLKE